MRTGRRRWGLMAAVAAAGVGAFIAPETPAVAQQTCPPGLVEDVQTPGFQCVPACPPGTLLDGVSKACVAAPGVPPPPLP